MNEVVQLLFDSSFSIFHLLWGQLKHLLILAWVSQHLEDDVSRKLSAQRLSFTHEDLFHLVVLSTAKEALKSLVVELLQVSKITNRTIDQTVKDVGRLSHAFRDRRRFQYFLPALL